MQEIIKNCSTYWFVDDVLSLYSLYSDLDNIDNNINEFSINSKLKDLCDVISVGEGKKHNINFTNFDYNKIKVDSAKNIIVCFSGGKDSVSTALKYKNEGYNVFLYHIQGINGVYNDEWMRAKDIADYLDLPLYIEKIKLEGNNTYLEHCMKNQVVVSLALNYGLRNNISSVIAYGDFKQDKVDEGLFDRNWSDTQEMWEAYKKYINNYVEGFELKIPFNNYIETLDVISQDLKLMSKVQGCLSPQRFREHLHVKNQDKYSVDLLPNRCGSCWKCCVEYVYLTDTDKIKYNDEMYRHCFDIFKSKWKEEKPFLEKPKTDKDLYLAYMLSEDLYSKSKLKNGFLDKNIEYVDIKSLYENKKEIKKVELF